MMTSENIERLKTLQQRLVEDAEQVTTRNDLIRLRAYWGDIQRILDSEESTD